MHQQPLLPEVLGADGEPVRGAPNGGRGRPPGAKNLKHRVLERMARSESLAIVAKLCELAKAGDVLAARVILDRIWPRPRTAPFAVDLAPTRTPAELRAAMHDLLRRVGSGEIAPDDGQALIAMMRDVLDTHRVQTLNPVLSIEIGAQATAREQLADRLTRLIADRERAGDPPE